MKPETPGHFRRRMAGRMVNRNDFAACCRIPTKDADERLSKWARDGKAERIADAYGAEPAVYLITPGADA